jgi:hypothetical protein
MKKTLFYFLLALIINDGWTQNPNLDYKSSIKLNNLSIFEDFEMVYKPASEITATDYYYNFSNSIVFNPNISIQLLSNQRNFHEIEFTSFTYEKKGFDKSYIDQENESMFLLEGHEKRKLFIAFRYEYSYQFFKQTDSKLVPSIGLGIYPYYSQLTTVPFLSNSYPTTEKLFSLGFQVIPRISYFLTQKFFIDVNLPLSVFDYKYLNFHIDDPSIIEYFRTKKAEKTSFFPKTYLFRVGLGYKFL